jgi:hypothetical protein
LHVQRTAQNKGELKPDQKNKLIEAFGEEVFDKKNASWEESFEQCKIDNKKWCAITGNAQARLDTSEKCMMIFKTSSEWFQKQKSFQRRGELALERQAKLKEAFGDDVFDIKEVKYDKAISA